MIISFHYRSCTTTAPYRLASYKCIAPCDDDSDDIIASCMVSKGAALRIIGKLTSIEPVYIQVALSSGESAESFKFFLSCNFPLNILHFGAWTANLSEYYVSEGDIYCAYIMIGLPVLRHLDVDTKILLEPSHAALNCADSSTVSNTTTSNGSGRVSHMKVAHLNRVADEITSQHISPSGPRPRMDFYTASNGPKQFPIPSLLERIYEFQHEEVCSATAGLVEDAIKRKW